VIVASEAMATTPNTALALPTAPVALIGLALVALATVTALPMAVRRARS
jgi:hypothetical protein